MEFRTSGTFGADHFANVTWNGEHTRRMYGKKETILHNRRTLKNFSIYSREHGDIFSMCIVVTWMSSYNYICCYIYKLIFVVACNARYLAFCNCFKKLNLYLFIGIIFPRDANLYYTNNCLSFFLYFKKHIFFFSN